MLTKIVKFVVKLPTTSIKRTWQVFDKNADVS